MAQDEFFYEFFVWVQHSQRVNKMQRVPPGCAFLGFLSGENFRKTILSEKKLTERKKSTKSNGRNIKVPENNETEGIMTERKITRE